MHADNSQIYLLYAPNLAQLCSSATYGYGYPVWKADENGNYSSTWTDGFGRIIEADEPDSSNNSPSTRATATTR